MAKNYFKLDGGVAQRIIESLVSYGIVSYSGNPNEWRDNPFIEATFTGGHSAEENYNCPQVEAIILRLGFKVTLTRIFEVMAICQAYVLDNINGPEGDGARQMLRKHWYRWAKACLQAWAVYLQTTLLPNGTPDGQGLAALMSKVYGEWNMKGLIEYRDLWIENNTAKFIVFPEEGRLDEITIVVCEKDAVYAGVSLTAAAMGAWAAYSCKGKSGRSGMEKLFYAMDIDRRVRNGEDVYLLVISDWDTDGEEVIAPTVFNQLSTYMPAEQIRYLRVGINPDQLKRFGYSFQDKWYEAKYRVGEDDSANYLTWCRDKAIYYYECDECGWIGELVGTECPGCRNQILDPGEPPSQSAAKKEWKEPFLAYYDGHTPHGLELDALLRTEYCLLLSEGLDELIGFDRIREELSQRIVPDTSNMAYYLSQELLDENESYRELKKYQDSLENWFNKKMESLRQTAYSIERNTRDKVRELLNAHADDSDVFKYDPWPELDDLVKHLQSAKPITQECTSCGRPTFECRYPEWHKDSWRDAPEERMFEAVHPFQPYKEESRTTALKEIVLEEERNTLDEIKEEVFEFERVDINLEDDQDENE
jgi:hypothetical protein